MQQRLFFCLFLLNTPSDCLPGAEKDAPVTYTQEYSIVLKGAVSGIEKVTERISREGKVLANSTHEILVTDGVETKRMMFTTSMSLQKGTWFPIHYSCRYSSGEARDSYEVSVRDGQVVRTLTRSGRTSVTKLQLQPGFAIVDFNVYYQYDYLLQRYDLRRGGKQTFMNFLPLIAAEIPVALTRLEDSTVRVGDKALEVRNFRIEFGSSWVGIARSDKNGRLVHLILQDKELEVVRKDLLPE